MTDQSALSGLALRAKKGDADALAELLAALRPEIVRVTRLIVGSGSNSGEDAAQEALIDVFRGIAQLSDARAVRAWSLRVATRRALKIARRERLLRRRSDVVAEPTSDDQPGRFASIKEAFDGLPPRQRAVAVLRLYAGLSEAETGTVLGCSVGTVKSQLHDARARLARSLRDETPIVPTREPLKGASQ
jgi:RNA polymerase sigma factor (sigma-70 family)